MEIDEARIHESGSADSSCSGIEENTRSTMDLGDGWFIRSQTQWICWLGSFCAEPIWIVWLFCGATESDRELDEWHGEEDHTNNTGQLKSMLVAHLLIRDLQDVASWQEARHEAPSRRLRDTRNVTVMGHEWSNPLPKSKNARTV